MKAPGPSVEAGSGRFGIDLGSVQRQAQSRLKCPGRCTAPWLAHRHTPVGPLSQTPTASFHPSRREEKVAGAPRNASDSSPDHELQRRGKWS